jgi:hypothetical protein
LGNALEEDRLAFALADAMINDSPFASVTGAERAQLKFRKAKLIKRVIKAHYAEGTT